MTTLVLRRAFGRALLCLCLIGLSHSNTPAQTDSLPVVQEVEWQPFQAQVRRIVEALDYLGEPLSPNAKQRIQGAFKSDSGDVAALQEVLDQRALFFVDINPEMRVKVAPGAVAPELDQNGWRVFLVKVRNQAGTTAELRAGSPNAAKLHGSPAEDLADRWLDLAMFNSQPLAKNLNGLELEYRLIQLYSRDAGKREAKIAFDVGQGTQDLGFRNEVNILFTARPANKITLRILDEHGAPATASFEVRDKLGRVYPAQSKRLAPDFAFHPQVYRSDRETLELPSGTYDILFSRGPESLPQRTNVEITPDIGELKFQVKRWIDPSLHGWWSGDHHIHAAGCAHYTRPTEGVHAPDMIRHCLGEDLKIGANLTWGPCFDYQKQFFTGEIDKVSRYPYLLRYDIEVSGFGSHQSGHLCLLRLRDQMYPGGESKDHWPTLCLNTLRWAKKQGAVVGPAHSGWGLEVNTDELPNYVVPPFSGIGANEYIVDVTHQVPGPNGELVPAVDFISTVDTPYVWELNIWYHTLNCGFRTRISGETDFPCIYGERVGLGRSYVKVDGPLNYDAWCEGIRNGRNYVGDGRSHIIDFKVENVSLGEAGSELNLPKPGEVRVEAKVAALLNEKPDAWIQAQPYTAKPYWHIERARIGQTRRVSVELLVNGEPVAEEAIPADGELRDLNFTVPIHQSSWVALRILPSSHTNPIWVTVGGEPVRASRRSAEWCLKGVDQCWSQKKRFIAESELRDAEEAYEHARRVYRKILAESKID